jgi:multiple sugar transport system substrate-binding protein
MDQPPLDLSAVDRANVHPTYKRAMTLFQERVKLAPSAVVKNPAVADVLGEMKPIEPSLGQIVQGAFSGDVTDYKATLQDYSDKLSAERERAVGVVQGKGAKVSLDDWTFANWQPGQDYTAESYT